MFFLRRQTYLVGYELSTNIFVYNFIQNAIYEEKKV